MFDSDRFHDVLLNLLSRTESGKVTWTRGATGRVFLTQVGGVTVAVRCDLGYSDNDDHDQKKYVVSILTSGGEVATEGSATDPESVFSALYHEARSSAFQADKLLETLEGELQKL